MKRIAVLTSGGDAPGMNAAIRAVTLVGLGRGAEVFGVDHGYDGLVNGHLRPLEPDEVAGIIRDGGTVLGSARCLPFLEREGRDRARANLAALGIEGVVVIGGNGSLTGMQKLTDPEESDGTLRAVGVPASIDNDLGITRLAIGVDTAINTIVDACDKISDTASAHDRAFIVEVMGRQCGYLAMTSGIASAANVVLFPEMERTEDEIVETVVNAIVRAQSRKGRSKRVLIIKAEGVAVTTDRLKAEVEARVAERLGPTGAKVDMRVTVLGHVVRGGRPSAMDRQIGSRLGNAAISALLNGKTRVMTAWLPSAKLSSELAEASSVDPQVTLVDMQYVLDETKAMLDGTSQFVKWRRKVFRDIEDVLTW